MESKGWKAYAVAMSLVVGAFFFSPDEGWTPVIWQVLVGWAGAAAVIAGIRIHRPPAPAAWYLFAAGVFLNSSGILVAQISAVYFKFSLPPTPADLFWLCVYPAVIAGLILLIVHRTARREWASLVDAMTISTGLGLLVWVFIIRPSFGTPELSAIGQATVVAYPIGDIVVLAMVVRLLIGSGARGTSYWVLGATVVAFLTGDMGWATTNQLGLTPGSHATHLLEMVFLVGFTLFGVAALHPSIRQVTESGPVRQARPSPALLLVLTAVSLIAPFILVLEVSRHHVEDGIAIAIGSVSLFLLVITRMAQLLREVEKQSEWLKELTQVDELTGLPNRRAWSAELPRAIERARRDGLPLSVAMIDLDHFKRFNDEYGHPAGDRLLKAASVGWLAQSRGVDQLARYGGEEFILLLPNTETPIAVDILARLRDATPLDQTFSAGVAMWDGTETSAELIIRADGALYQAKADGRNRTTIAVTPDPKVVRPDPGAARLTQVDDKHVSVDAAI
ncbi:MAG: putative signaling protein [Frankiales bacterium]|nr:putative signaling protein [Frankiales bacterium]